jgi:endonuclease YncB( thermonuclease family)
LGVPALVEQIVDGDTIAVRIDDKSYKLRYIGIDTPETGQPFATEATAQNRALVEGQTVYLQKDVSETDKYQRLLRYVYLADGTFVNLELVKQGYAHAITYPPDVRHEAQLRQAQQEAVSAGRGLWQWPRANRDANLRGGPGTDYPVIGGVKQGQMLTLLAQNTAGDWYQLDNQAWIAATLVDRAPATMVIAAVIPTLPPPPTATPAPVQPAQPAAPPAAPEGGTTNVHLQSVMYDGAVARVESDEYAIIVNTGSAAANIGGWRLNAGDPGQDFVFPSFTLAPGQAVRVYTDEHHPDSGGFRFGSGKAIWNNKGDCGYLYDAGGAEVDQYCY